MDEEANHLVKSRSLVSIHLEDALKASQNDAQIRSNSQLRGSLFPRKAIPSRESEDNDDEISTTERPVFIWC